MTHLRPDCGDPRFEIAEARAQSAVTAELTIEIADEADVRLRRHEVRGAPVYVAGHAVLVVGVVVLASVCFLGTGLSIGRVEEPLRPRRPLESTLLKRA